MLKKPIPLPPRQPFPVYSPEDREAINKTLREVLSPDGYVQNHWDEILTNLREKFGIETDLLWLAQNAPNLTTMFEIGALSENSIITLKTRNVISGIIHRLFWIAYHADNGDEFAANQLLVLHKLAYPSNYELPATVIKTLADSYHTSPHLARAWAVRRLMLSLSFITEPTRPDRSLLDGPVRLMARSESRPEFCGERELYNKASKHVRRGTTLKSLAIAIYIEELDKEGIRIDPRQIKLDLQKLKEFESTNLKDYPLSFLGYQTEGRPPAYIPGVPVHSEDGWKRLWRRGAKKRK